jgi:hypothetical protein
MEMGIGDNEKENDLSVYSYTLDRGILGGGRISFQRIEKEEGEMENIRTRDEAIRAARDDTARNEKAPGDADAAKTGNATENALNGKSEEGSANEQPAGSLSMLSSAKAGQQQAMPMPTPMPMPGSSTKKGDTSPTSNANAKKNSSATSTPLAMPMPMPTSTATSSPSKSKAHTSKSKSNGLTISTATADNDDPPPTENPDPPASSAHSRQHSREPSREPPGIIERTISGGGLIATSFETEKTEKSIEEGMTRIPTTPDSQGVRNAVRDQSFLLNFRTPYDEVNLDSGSGQEGSGREGGEERGADSISTTAGGDSGPGVNTSASDTTTTTEVQQPLTPQEQQQQIQEQQALLKKRRQLNPCLAENRIPKNRPHFKALQAARFFFACWVFFHHVGKFPTEGLERVRSFTIDMTIFVFLTGFTTASGCSRPILAGDRMDFWIMRMGEMRNWH